MNGLPEELTTTTILIPALTVASASAIRKLKVEAKKINDGRWSEWGQVEILASLDGSPSLPCLENYKQAELTKKTAHTYPLPYTSLVQVNKQTDKQTRFMVGYLQHTCDERAA